MRFVPWYPLEEAGSRAPRAPGVYQIRIASGLIHYPTGKSAMILYGAAEDVQRAVTELAGAHPGEAWLCRHAVDLSPQEAAAPDEVLARLVERFRRRFGAPPTLPP